MTDGMEKSQREESEKRWRRRDFSGGVVGAVDCSESFVVSGESASGGVLVVGPGKDVGMFVDRCVSEVDSPQSADVILDAIEKKEFWSA